MKSGTRTYAYTVGIAIIIGVGLLLGMTTCVDRANAGFGSRAGVERHVIETFYDEGTSVFCAARYDGISCVYVPRDTVRPRGGDNGAGETSVRYHSV